MKTLSKFFILSFAAFSLASCANDNSQDKKIKINNLDNRALESTVELGGTSIKVKDAEMLNIAVGQKAANDDAAAAQKVFQNMLNAAQKNTMQDVQLITNNEPIDNGVFVFGLDAQDSKKIVFEMYDEEGHQIAAQNTINLTAGKNYKALNVKALESGAYRVRLKDNDGKEIVSRIQVNNNN